MPTALSGSRPRRLFFHSLSSAACAASLMSALGVGLVFFTDHRTWPDFLFIFLFVFRYLRLLVHTVAYWLYIPSPASEKPKFSGKDATIILPTIDPGNHNFLPCLARLVANRPHEIVIATAGHVLEARTNAIVDQWKFDNLVEALTVNIRVTSIATPGKRQQVAHVVPQVKTPIIVSVDDSVIWPGDVLSELLKPFEDDTCGFVGTNKRVERDYTKGIWEQFWNFIGCVYLERHNFEIRATNAIDGGVFVVSGRTAAIRTEIMKQPEFLEGLTNEMFFFGRFGPLGPDDDNFISRWVLSKGWSIKIQYTDAARIETRLGEYPRFLNQAERWVRTTWRSNAASLFTERTCWTRWPWTTYAAFISSFFNFAALYDPLLLVLLCKTTYFEESGRSIFGAMVAWILASKVVKLLPHFILHPRDMWFFPGYVMFAYYHSWLKLWTLCTFWNNAWSGRASPAGDAG